MTERRIEYLPLDTITPAIRNPKRHDIDGIANSIRRFGFTQPALRDERTGRLVAGHGRLQAAVALRDAGETPPAGITVDSDGTWLAPVVRGWASRSDTEAEAYLVADNRWTEIGGWDNTELASLLQDVAASDAELAAIAGYSDEDLEHLLADLGPEELPPAGATDPDDIPPPPADPITKPGDLWLLGQHRVLCGDSTDIAAVEQMLDGGRADCMWTDPPYGVDYVGKTADALTIQNDGADGLPELLAGAFAVATAVLKPGAPVYVAHPAGALQRDFINAFEQAGWIVRQGLIWVKDAFALGHSDYHYRHEPISYGFTAGGDGRLGRGGDRWYGDNSQESVFEIPKPSRNADHPTMKPVALISAMLANSCPRGGGRIRTVRRFRVDADRSPQPRHAHCACGDRSAVCGRGLPPLPGARRRVAGAGCHRGAARLHSQLT